jgi:hypothetical protein
MPNTKKKILSTPIAIALIVVTIGTLIKVMHWPFASPLRLISISAIGVLYLIRYGYKKPKNIKDTVKVIMVVTWALLSVLVMFKMNNLEFLRIILMASGFSWLVLEVWDIIQKNPKSERANSLQLIGMFILMAHGAFSMMHWPFAGPMLLLSLVALILLAVGFIHDSKEMK